MIAVVACLCMVSAVLAVALFLACRNVAGARREETRAADSRFAQFQEKLSRYEAQVEKVSTENVRLGEHMKAQLSQLQRFADRVQSYTDALVGGSKIQGNRGEEILTNILEQSGFTEGREFDLQFGLQGEGRPDASVYDVMNKRIILIDAKMNIKDYISACAMPGDEAHKAEKERLFKAHAASVKRQIDNLSAKNYAATVPPSREGYTNLPLVAMFCPFNAVLESALQYDPTLVQHAFERNIVLVTPLTLWGYLWLVSWGWKQHSVERKIDEIQSLGKDVVSALDALVNDLETMGEMLQKTGAAFESLQKRATGDKGQTSVRRVAQKLIDYGIVPSGRLKRL